jgi:hypothetical protein
MFGAAEILEEVKRRPPTFVYRRDFAVDDGLIREPVQASRDSLEASAEILPVARSQMRGAFMPLLVAFMKIRHRTSMLTNHLIDMRNYMSAEHRVLIAEVEAMQSIRGMASTQNYYAVLDAMAEFRSVHYGWAQEYINRWTDDPRGTAALLICSG